MIDINTDTNAITLYYPSTKTPEQVAHDVKDLFMMGVPMGEIARLTEQGEDDVLDVVAPLMQKANTRDKLRAREFSRMEWQHRLVEKRLKANPSDDSAHELSMKLSKEKARLMGLNAPAQVQVQGDIKVTVEWAGPNRLSYNRPPADVVDMTPSTVTDPWKPPAEPKDPDVRFQNAIDALKKPGPALGSDGDDPR